MDNPFFANNYRLLEEQLLNTKLNMPRFSRQLVLRPRLFSYLAEGMERALTLISAPAGSGKTMLLCSWQTSSRNQLPCGWLSLDEGENDPIQFWRYFWAALGQLLTNLKSDALSVFQTTQTSSSQSLVMDLLHIFSTIHTPLALILEDYHVIRTPAIHQGLTFLLDHLPATVHLILVSREDPPFPLARLRERDQLVEIRAADLCFTLGEATAFLTEIMKLDLRADDIALLATRTEGWVGGLQLAALSLRGRSPIQTTEFLATFTGSHRYILDYLGEEVFLRQPEPIQQFLLQTSFLDRLSGPLCDAVTGGTNSQTLLEQLEQRNLFVIPLDNERRWYRYHHLFAEVLHCHLATMQQNELHHLLALLHRRASTWYEQHHSLANAIHHALAASAFDSAARLCEQIMQTQVTRGELLTLQSWFALLPQATLHRHPQLYLHYLFVLLVCGQIEEARKLVEKVERSLQDHWDFLDPNEQPLLAGQLLFAQSFCAFLQGDLTNTRLLCQQAQRLLPAGHLLLGGVPMLLGATFWLEGETTQASVLLTDAIKSNQEVGNLFFIRATQLALAQTEAIQGYLQKAAKRQYDTLMLMYVTRTDASEKDLPVYQASSSWPMHITERSLLPLQGTISVSLALLLYEQNLLEEAEYYLQRAIVVDGESDAPYVVTKKIILAYVLQAKGETKQAQMLMQQAIQLAQQQHIARTLIIPSIGATQAWLALLQGNFQDAIQWAEEKQSPSLSASLPAYSHEVDEIMRARVYLVQRKPAEALSLLSQLYPAAMTMGHMRSALEILILQALGEQALGNTARALSALGTALQLAEPEKYVRLFVNENEPMVRLLLWHCTEPHDTNDFAHILLESFSQKSIHSSSQESCHQRCQSLLEPLSSRELEVLQSIAAGSPNQEIADQLVIAESTVKRHIHNIFGKLGVSSRTQAVARARELELF